MASNPPQPPAPVYQQPPMAPPAPKKTSPWVWVAAGCGGLLVVVVLAVVVGGFFVARKVKSAVGDGKNPAVTAIRIAAMVNPDLEIVSQDDAAQTVTIRDKKTGKTITLNAQDIKNGRLSFTDEKGQEVTMEAKGEGESGQFKIKTAEGEASFGGGSDVKAPSWVPMYPGVKPEGTFSGSSKGQETGAFSFKTGDSLDRVMAFYKSKLEGEGFEVSETKSSGMGQKGGVVTGNADNGKRTVGVMVGEEAGKTTVAVTYQSGTGQ